MDKDRAWNMIVKQIHSDDRRIALIAASILMAVIGAFVIIVCTWIGIGMVIAGAIMLTVVVRAGGRGSIDIMDLYSRYVLPGWLAEVITEVDVSDEFEFDKDEIRAVMNKMLPGLSWSEMECDLSFAGKCNGIPIRASQIRLLSADDNETGYYKNEPEIVYGGMIWQYGEDGIAVNTTGNIMWLPVPDKDNEDEDELKQKVLDYMKPYMEQIK